MKTIYREELNSGYYMFNGFVEIGPLIPCESNHAMPKTLVGKMQNKKFAYFWLLIGGSLGNLSLILYSPNAWPLFLPPAVLSLLLVIAIADSKKRPKMLLGIDAFLTCALLISLLPPLGSTLKEITVLLPAAMLVFGCILGIMNW